MISRLLLMTLLPVFLLLISCGPSENVREALNYYDASTETVGILAYYEGELRLIADGLLEGKPLVNSLEKVRKIKDLLDDILLEEKRNLGDWNEKNRMKVQLLNWAQSLHMAAEEGLKENPNMTQKALRIYHYLDIAAEMGRITRSEREYLFGSYRGLH